MSSVEKRVEILLKRDSDISSLLGDLEEEFNIELDGFEVYIKGLDKTVVNISNFVRSKL